MFTDGEDAGSNARRRRRGALQTSDLTLYMIGQGRDHERVKEVMERLSRPTGGRAFFTETLPMSCTTLLRVARGVGATDTTGYQSTTAFAKYVASDQGRVNGQRRFTPGGISRACVIEPTQGAIALVVTQQHLSSTFDRMTSHALGKSFRCAAGGSWFFVF